MTAPAQGAKFGQATLNDRVILRCAYPLLYHPRAVDDAGQPPGNGGNHAGHGGQQEHRRHRQLNAMGDGVRIQRNKGHG